MEAIKKRAKKIVDILEEKKGEDILVLKVGDVSSFAEYMIIVTAKNDIQLKTMVDEVFYRLKEESHLPHHKEGDGRSGWILLDYGDIILNVMSTDKREYYKLEELWFEAPQVEL